MSYESYFKIRAALARDTFDGIPDEARKITDETTDAFIARTSAALANTRDLNQARRAFGELSRAFIASPERSPRGPVYVVECSMAKPFGRWIQETREIGNPYYGSSMLRCGRVVETRSS